MFRRALAFFCLPCGRETDSDDLRVIAVCDEDADPVFFSPQDLNVVRLQFRLGPGQEGGVPSRAVELQKTLMSADAADVSLEERPWPQDSHQEEGFIGKMDGATVTSTVAAADFGVSGGEEAPPTVRRRRRCRRCWAERLAVKVILRPRGRRGYRLNRE